MNLLLEFAGFLGVLVFLWFIGIFIFGGLGLAIEAINKWLAGDKSGEQDKHEKD